MSGLAHERVTQSSRASVAARLCWEVAQLCRTMDAAAEQLQVALVEAAEHANAVIEIALVLDGAHARTDAEVDSCAPSTIDRSRRG